jgi:hypothetical protein
MSTVDTPGEVSRDVTSAPSHDSLADELERLAGLRAAGALSDAEYEEAKRAELAEHAAAGTVPAPAAEPAAPAPTMKEAATALAAWLNGSLVGELREGDEVLTREPYRSHIDWGLAASHRDAGSGIGLRGDDGAFLVVRPSPYAPWEVQAVRAHGSRRWMVGVAALAVAGLVGGGLGAGALMGGTSKDAKYMKTLTSGGLAAQFSSQANAVAHAHEVCKQLNDGGKQQGLPADKVAVDTYCSKFASGFKVLATAHITGTFTLVDTSLYSSGISAIGGTCMGDGGYGDINSSTEVIVKNDAGTVLARTPLGVGTGDVTRCTFSFGFDVTEGEDNYVVSVSHRGETSFTFDELKNNGIALSLGS